MLHPGAAFFKGKQNRAVFTTFYPNVLSGGLSWIGLSQYFPTAAVFILGLSIFFSRWLSLFSGFLLASMAFVLVSPTPEPQFLPIIIFIAVAGRLSMYEVELSEQDIASVKM
jgi:hypothetical protein